MIPVDKIVFIFLLFGYSKLVLAEKCHVKSICESKDNITSDIILQECQENRNFSVRGRCCYHNDLILGIDLNGCEISSVVGKLTHYPDLVILGLEGNPRLNCTDENEYIGLKKIDFLVLPDSCDCPGNWKHSNVTRNSTVCNGIIDQCVQLNITCPEYGMCVSDGPGIASCECVPGHYGYKCLREGTFPMVPFSVGIVVPTLVLSFFVWFTQRRLVKKNN